MNDDSQNQNSVIEGINVAVLVGVELATLTGRLAAAEGLKLLGQRPHLICHASFLIDRLAFAAGAPRGAARAAKEQKHLDVAELFAFVCPAQIGRAHV